MRGQKGIALVEALLAAAVLAAGIAAVFQTFSVARAFTAWGDDRLRAQLFLDSRAWEMKTRGAVAADPLPLPGATLGQEPSDILPDCRVLTLRWPRRDQMDELRLTACPAV